MPALALLQRRLARNPGLRGIIHNIGWLFFDHALKIGVGLFVGVWLARYLGPEQFGLFNYATAMVAMFGTIASLGLNGIVVRDLVKHPEQGHVTLGTAFALRLGGAAVAITALLVTVGWILPKDRLTTAIIAIIAATLIFKASEVIKYWFESQVASRHTVIVENSAFLLSAGLKVLMIAQQAPLIAFVWLTLADAVIVSIGLFVVYFRRENALRFWTVRTQRAKTLLRDSWPLILSGLAVMVYMRIDQIMLKEMIGTEAVGIYSAALRISEAWYTVPTIIVASLFPAIIASKSKDEKLYQARMQRLLNFLVAFSLAVAVIITLTANGIITLLFGANYSDAAPVLMIHVWAGIFTSIGMASGKWYLLEDMSRLLFYRTLAGAVVNVPLNLLLIPLAGAKGAATATIISYCIAAFFYDLATPKTRLLFKLKSNALSLRWVYALGK